VLLGLFIYGGWYYATQSGGTGIKLIDQVPEYIKKATGVGQTADEAPANPAPADQNSASKEPARTEAQAATTPEPAPAAQPSPVSPPAATNAPAASPPASPEPTPAAPAVALNSGGTVTPAPSPAPAVVATPTGNAPATVPSPSGPSLQAAPATTPQPPAAGDAAASAAQPQATQEANASAEAAAVPPAAKVVIRANRDAWIEIRDDKDAVVLQRVLRQGESYNVPDQKGLVMTTGNAGGIVIELEGKPLQSLGSLGVVKRGIKLDPAALADGSAFNTDENQ